MDLMPFAEAEAGEQEPLIAFLREIFGRRTRDEWVVWFSDKDVAFSLVFDFREAFDQPHIAERGLLVEVEGRHHLAPPIRFASEPEWRPGPIPDLGAD